MAYRSSTQATGTDQVILSLPASTADGDHLIYWIESFGETVTWTFTPAVTGSVTVTGAGSGRPTVWSYATKVASSEPGSRTITIGGGTILTVKGIVASISGRSSTNPTVQETDVAGDSASPTAAALAGLTAASGDDVVGLYAIASGNASGTWVLTPPASYTLRETVTGTGAFHGGGIALVTRDNTSGATGTLTGTWTLAANGGETSGVLLAFNVSGGGGGGSTDCHRLLLGVG
jgi:hypothetical protein